MSIDDKAKVILFGSRTDDSKRGGDIDILIVSEKINRQDIRRVRSTFVSKFGEQKLDIILDDGSFIDPFRKMAYNTGIRI